MRIPNLRKTKVCEAIGAGGIQRYCPDDTGTSPLRYEQADTPATCCAEAIPLSDTSILFDRKGDLALHKYSLG